MKPVKIVMHRFPDVTQEERQRRIHQTYQYILSRPLLEKDAPKEEHDANPT